MQNNILKRRAALEAALSTVNYQIKHLKAHFSREQIRCWYVHRNRIVDQLKNLPTVEQVKQDAKRHTSLIKQILRR